MTIGGEQIGFNVVDGRAVHEVGASHKKRGILRVEICLDEFHTGEADGVGAKGERVANTPMRRLPPSRGGRTVGDHCS